MGRDDWSRVAVPLLAGRGGVVTATELCGHGLSAETLRTLVAQGRLVRLRRNVLVDGEVWRGAPPWSRHLLRARGAMLLLGEADPPLALSHHSALAAQGLAIHAADDDVHVVRVGHGTSRRRPGLVRHAAVDPALVTTAAGMPAVTPAVACLQVASAFGVEAGLVAADSALRLGACAPADLEALRGWAWLGRGRRAAGVVADLADGRHESAGESRAAMLLHRLGHQTTPQVWVRERDGSPIGRVDLLVTGTRVVIEFDGRLKYGRAQDLMAEKVREDRIRERGYEVVRLTWADLEHPARVDARVRAALARDAARRSRATLPR